METTLRTDVLIVGGGPAGLSMAALLGRFGVDCVLVERRAAVNRHPRARSINVRTSEIFRQLGILDEIRAVCLPPEWCEEFIYTETLTGPEIGRTSLKVQPIVGGVAVSPAPWLLSSQDRIEPIIRARAESYPTVDVRFGTELSSVEVDGHAVRATLTSGPATPSTIQARYVVAADGAGSLVRRSLDIDLDGPTELATLVNCHFNADLGPWTDHRPAGLYWTTAPARNVFQKIDTDDRWLCQIGYDPRVNQPEDFTPEMAAAWIRRSIGDPDVAIEVLDVIPWVMASTVAERLRHDSAFLIGDAAHQLPPSGGFGMNTAIQDAHNLAWKLAYVLRGWAGDELLDTYHEERAPIARYNADRSLENTRNVGRIRKQFEAGGNPDEVAAAVAATGRYGNWLGMDLGLHYEAGCLLPDGTPLPAVDDPVADYVPCARPGHRAPHLDLGSVSTLDAYDDAFTLLVGDDRADLDDVHPAVRTQTLEWHNAEALALHGISATGALLVRPDGHVAWRMADEVTSDDVAAAVVGLGLRS